MLEVSDKVAVMTQEQMKDAFEVGIVTFKMHDISNGTSHGEEATIQEIDFEIVDGAKVNVAILEDGYSYNMDLLELV